MQVFFREPNSLKKIGETGFSEVYSFKPINKENNLIIKVMLLDSNRSDAVSFDHIWHEIQISKSLYNLSKLRKYCIPTGWTGFCHITR